MIYRKLYVAIWQFRALLTPSGHSYGGHKVAKNRGYRMLFLGCPEGSRLQSEVPIVILAKQYMWPI
jgi:hypothetical protein